ncbi:MAG: aminopeptidase P family N-terminal domain-containing protein, partial [Mesorhizobium sp.]
MHSEAPKGNFGRHRKIMPFEPGSIKALRDASRQKAASLNQHVLGYGAQAEAEWEAAGIAAPDLAEMRKYRLERIRAELKRQGYAGALLYDPINIRYATDSTNMQLWVAHNPTRHCFVATDGPVVLFDYFSCEHLSDHSGVVDEVRPAVSWMYLYGGELTEQKVRRW